MYEEYYQLIEECKDKQFNFFIGGRNCGKTAFINEIFLLKTGRRVTPMEYRDYAYYSEVVEQRVECLREGDKMREEVLIDTIYRQNEMIKYLRERVVHCDGERFK